MQHAGDYGLSADNVSYDPKAVVQRSRGVSKRLNDGVGFLMKKNKVSVIWARPPSMLRQDHGDEIRRRGAQGNPGRGRYQAKHIILATARGRACCRLEPDKKLIWTISRPWCPKRCRSPSGGGLRRDRHRIRLVLPHHGADVTVVEVLPQILPVEDAEIAVWRASVRKTGHQDPHQYQGDETREEERQRGRHH